MQKKSCVAVILALVFSLGLALSAHAEPIVVKFSHVVAENTPKGKMANKFRDLVAEQMGDKVVVEVYPNSQLFNDNAVLEALLLGDVQLAAPALSKFQKYTDVLQLYDLPFLFKDMEAVECFQQGPFGKKMLKSMMDKGVLGLGYLHNGLKQLSANSPLRVPADAAGKKFRIMTSDVLAAQFEAVDAIPLKKPFSEVFTLLQTKAIDGQENTWSNIYSKKFYEVQPYITESNHGLLDYLVVTSAEFWNGLPEDVAAGLESALAEALEYGNAESFALSEEQKQMIIDSGRTEIIELTPEERALWVEAMKPVWDEFAPAIGQDNIDAAVACNK
ncbi:TRAP transporter substrate-binding protein [Oceanidesulfovibrio marinus]|uniref:C4-dicarboxylate ABC transporter n=1 Tax=Oceanidesulfovibrio marinus TaxID=370038 RepID=A0A6P1ZQB6_9BACT|nr:TRAP transporter substrate-binding protein [Oceanidesulfovibrio marinus]QJT08804.1 DctP family TRAP transporter solute-binding subunit [Oceanidesulfovibrio marinus]TVM36768.1 C4-dicarboxylate ABC transporter [Oceanidesulfovibrio marinus]